MPRRRGRKRRRGEQQPSGRSKPSTAFLEALEAQRRRHEQMAIPTSTTGAAAKEPTRIPGFVFCPERDRYFPSGTVDKEMEEAKREERKARLRLRKVDANCSRNLVNVLRERRLNGCGRRRPLGRQGLHPRLSQQLLSLGWMPLRSEVVMRLGPLEVYQSVAVGRRMMALIRLNKAIIQTWNGSFAEETFIYPGPQARELQVHDPWTSPIRSDMSQPSGSVGCFVDDHSYVLCNLLDDDADHLKISPGRSGQYREKLLAGKVMLGEYSPRRVAFLSTNETRGTRKVCLQNTHRENAYDGVRQDGSDLITHNFGDMEERSLLFGYRNGTLGSWDSRQRDLSIISNVRSFNKALGSISHIRPLVHSPYGLVIGCTQTKMDTDVLFRFDRRFLTRPVCTYEGHRCAHYAQCQPAVDRDERVLTACDLDGCLRVWDLASGELWRSVLLDKIADRTIAQCKVYTIQEGVRNRQDMLEIYCTSENALYRISPENELDS